MKNIYRIPFFIILLTSVCVLCGCSRSRYAENQVYAVMLGIDSENSEVKLTVRYPKLAGSQGGSGSGSESGYADGHSKGSNFQQALDALRIEVPREINLSALTMVVISDEIAATDEFVQIIDGLAANYRMYSSSYIAICKGKASEFVANQEPDIGSRLSEGLKSLAENAEEIGFIPGSRLADVYYRMNSIYSDPLIMLCTLQKTDNISSESQSKSENIYAGSCAIGDGKRIVDFTPRETLLINMLSGDTDQFLYTEGETAAEISIDKGPQLDISVIDRLNISISFKLSGKLMNKNSDMQTVIDALKQDLYEVIAKCRINGTEPFGFADAAAMKFPTVRDWTEYHWREKFKNSNINIDITMAEVF